MGPWYFLDSHSGAIARGPTNPIRPPFIQEKSINKVEHMENLVANIKIWRFPEMVVPLNHIHFNKGLSIVHQPAIGDPPCMETSTSSSLHPGLVLFFGSFLSCQIPVIPTCTSSHDSNILPAWWPCSCHVRFTSIPINFSIFSPLLPPYYPIISH